MKEKIIKYSEYAVLIGMAAFGVVFSTLNKFNETAFYTVIGLFSGATFVELIFIIIKLSCLENYDFKKYTPYLHASYLVGSILMYYLCRNFKHFMEYSYLYWLGLLGLNSVLIITFLILNKRCKNDKPRLIPNRH